MPQQPTPTSTSSATSAASSSSSSSLSSTATPSWNLPESKKRVAIGTMQWSASWLDVKLMGSVPPDSVLDEIVSKCLKAGVTFFDSASGYGPLSVVGSEARLGLALRRAGLDREAIEKLNISSKFLPTPLSFFGAQAFESSLDGSLKRLGINCLDVYYIHTPLSMYDFCNFIPGAAECVKKKKMRYLGLSNFDADQIKRACECAKKYKVPVANCQLQFNLLTQKSPKLQAALTEAQKNQKLQVVTFSVLAQGLLSKPDLTEQEAKENRILRICGLKYEQVVPIRECVKKIAEQHKSKMSAVLISHARSKGVIPLVGCRKAYHVDDVIESDSLQLSQQDIADLDAVSLDRHTFERPAWRRGIFVFLICLLQVAYKFTHLFMTPPKLN